MELKSYLATLGRRKWVVLAVMLFATLVTAIGSYLMAPQYATSATLWIPTVDSTDGAQTGDIQLGDRLINTYATLATSGPVMRELERRLGVPADEIKESISAESIAQTELLQITVKQSNPKLASAIATTLSEVLIEETLSTKAGRSRRVTLFGPAGIPDVPTWMGLVETPFWREINILLGALLGLLGGVALAFVYEYVDSTLYTREQIEAVADLQTLGQIPMAKPRQLFVGNTLFSEAFRFLRMSIFFDQSVPLRTLLVTSALPGEGKSSVVANLAIAIAQAQQTVIVVDADLRLPTLHRLFGLSTNAGLSSLLRQQHSLEEALQSCEIPGVRVITSGPATDHPGELLDSPQFRSLLTQLREQADYVLVDSPAAMAVSDAAVIAPLVDGVLLVVGRAQAYQEAVRTTRLQLSAVGAHVVGIAVNRAGQLERYFRRYVSHLATT